MIIPFGFRVGMLYLCNTKIEDSSPLEIKFSMIRGEKLKNNEI